VAWCSESVRPKLFHVELLTGPSKSPTPWKWTDTTNGQSFSAFGQSPRRQRRSNQGRGISTFSHEQTHLHKHVNQLIFCLLVAYPLGSLFIRVPSSSPALRHAFNVAVAVLFFFPVLKIYSAFFQLLGSILATFTIAKYVKSSKMPWIVFMCVISPTGMCWHINSR